MSLSPTASIDQSPHYPYSKTHDALDKQAKIKTFDQKTHREKCTIVSTMSLGTKQNGFKF